MTNFRFLFLVFCPCGNDEILSFRNLSEKTETAPPSFPQKRESRNEKQQEFIGNDRN
ncbi:pilS cassette [Neisseria meningitidis]|uniref:PilS cassette n=1 Tax=Neisseria meningitidis TaxID=487 RepID=A0AB37K7G3_NEIME|nr:pilS cassette [Neisseria meningitidis]MBG8592498.1 pilS cassette [Neisseria meningitidis]MBG8607999.1 pilS cassette [Neisseria meningitidis]MBG8619072.1 pilS cassette [Neisseria meningitidis]MBG8623244.1 pilS cassette [Neisseria meningitidis]